MAMKFERARIIADYAPDRFSLVTAKGKFEREPIYAPAFWESALDGGADIDEGTLQGFQLTDDDLRDWPELAYDSYTVGAFLWLHESDQGFVSVVDEQTAKGT